ncbi:MAG: thermonuclease family protein [Chlamydiae bacterium]|nr:thermonuclease family protein [Chlamydiota bacterium]
MKKLFFFLLLINFSLYAQSNKTYGDVTVSELVSVYDGDTFKVNIKSYPQIIGEGVLVRIARIDTPELKDKNPKIKEMAKLAKEYCKNQLESAKEIKLVNIKRDKYFRILAEVYVDNKNLADIMLKSGLAKPYDGKKKIAWQ